MTNSEAIIELIKVIKDISTEAKDYHKEVIDAQNDIQAVSVEVGELKSLVKKSDEFLAQQQDRIYSLKNTVEKLTVLTNEQQTTIQELKANIEVQSNISKTHTELIASLTERIGAMEMGHAYGAQVLRETDEKLRKVNSE